MVTQQQKAATFAALHERPGTFIIPNPWDSGSAKMLTTLGFEALATTSAGLAFSLGKIDGTGSVTRAETLDNARHIVEATHLPVAADLENCFTDAPEEAGRTITMAGGVGLVGGSIEDTTGNPQSPIYDFDLAVARVRVAATAARALPHKFMLCARAENFLHGRPDLDDTIKRLRAFSAAGADVLYAPGLNDPEQIRAVIQAVDKPVNVLVSSWNADMTRDQLATLGVKRISVGGVLARAALGAFLRGAQEMRDHGSFGFAKDAASFGTINKLIEGKTG